MRFSSECLTHLQHSAVRFSSECLTHLQHSAVRFSSECLTHLQHSAEWFGRECLTHLQHSAERFSRECLTHLQHSAVRFSRECLTHLQHSAERFGRVNDWLTRAGRVHGEFLFMADLMSKWNWTEHCHCPASLHVQALFYRKWGTTSMGNKAWWLQGQSTCYDTKQHNKQQQQCTIEHIPPFWVVTLPTATPFLTQISAFSLVERNKLRLLSRIERPLIGRRFPRYHKSSSAWLKAFFSRNNATIRVYQLGKDDFVDGWVYSFLQQYRCA